jgi:hypothetical protein
MDSASPALGWEAGSHPSHAVDSEGWLGIRDGIRNWLVTAA